MKLVFKYLFSSINFIYDLVAFSLFKKKTSQNSYSFFILLFCLTGGISNKILDFILARKKRKLNSGIRKININDEKQAFFELKKRGYFYIKHAICNKDILKIKKFILSLKGRYSDDKYVTKEGFKEKLNSIKPKAVRFLYDDNDLIECKEIQKILIDESLYKITSNYFGKEPILDGVTAWWSFPSENADSNAAQKWHFDLERTKWLKIFIYLTDCDNKNGPHYFIESSHKDFGIPFSIRKNGYKRVEDNEIKKNYNSKNIKCFTSKQGGVLIEDTRGLHKGQNVKSGSRLILQLQYTTNLFNNFDRKIKFSKNFDKSFKKYKITNPYFFSNFQ